eukprot:5948100-Prymnesium_polylepis.1
MLATCSAPRPPSAVDHQATSLDRTYAPQHPPPRRDLAARAARGRQSRQPHSSRRESGSCNLAATSSPLPRQPVTQALLPCSELLLGALHPRLQLRRLRQ